MKNYVFLAVSFLFFSCSDDSKDSHVSRFVFENRTDQLLDSVLITNDFNAEKVVIRKIQHDNQFEGILKCENDLTKDGKYTIKVYKLNQMVAGKDFGTISTNRSSVSYFISLDEAFNLEIEEN
ncbi:hypothetical protein [Flavobacterium sp. H122]|uniref:hypothetical protein n=1 Tax=Flavobacterium sp. H122 TaxID=2529860 RepID=UPI0010AAA768|nr:hypothetical protein [Flavobacterium sp. H122]